MLMLVTMKTCLLLLTVSVLQASASFIRPVNEDCVEPWNPTADISLFPEQYLLIGDTMEVTADYTEITSARGFSVQYYDTYKIVKNSIANQTYVLLQCGAPEPRLDTIPPGATVFQVPLTSVSVPDTVPYAFLEVLGLQDRVSSVSQYVTSPCGEALLSCGENRIAPDVYVFDSQNATLVGETFGNSSDAILGTYSIASPQDIVFSGAEDPGVLNRVEWLKFIGLFFNKEREASEAFDAIRTSYESTVQAIALNDAPKPIVAWVQHYTYEPDESYQISFAAYKVEGTPDAGATMIDYDTLSKIPGVTVDPLSPTTLEFKWKGEGAGFESQEEAQAAFIGALKNVDYIIDETYAPDPTSYDFNAFLEEYGFNTSTTGLPFLANEGAGVLRVDGRLSSAPNFGLDWFEGAIVRPDKALADVATAIGTNPDPLPEFIWIRNIDQKPHIVGADRCPSRNECTGTPAVICPFVRACDTGSDVAILDSNENGQCRYAECVRSISPAPVNAAGTASHAMILLSAIVQVLLLL